MPGISLYKDMTGWLYRTRQNAQAAGFVFSALLYGSIYFNDSLDIAQKSQGVPSAG
jgi:hypothetical protein